MTAPYLIAGLGNPGPEYTWTRHNAGFRVLEELASGWRVEWRQGGRFRASLARVQRGGRSVWLVRPLTYMNVSGEAVGAVIRFYRVPFPQVLVIVDDADLPLGTLRMRGAGSSGGHHGLESVEAHLGTRDYARLRVGIGRVGEARDIAGHVLGRFAAEEVEVFERVLQQAVAQVTCWVEDGLEKAMARYNGPLK